MARPANKGLHYFPMDVGFFDDERIMLLMNRFGPTGSTAYSALLTIIYREGYFLRFSSFDTLALRVIRLIGSRWVSETAQIIEIIEYCGEIGLFDSELLKQGVITSVAIQKRYKEVTARLKASHNEYWLLDEDEPSADKKKSASQSAVTSMDNQSGADCTKPVSATETRVYVAETTLNKIKQNKTKKNKIKSNQMGEGCALHPAPADVPSPQYGQYGRFGNVRLTDAEYAALKNEVRDRDGLIDRVSIWMKGHGKQPADCYARLLQWDREDREKDGVTSGTDHRPPPSYDLEAFAQGGFDLDLAFDALNKQIG